MGEFNFLNLSAGFVAYVVGFVVGVVPLGYWAFVKLNFFSTARAEEVEIRNGNLAAAIEAGVVVLCQALLARHAVFALMAVVRTMFVETLTGAEIGWIILRSVLVWLVLVSLAIASVWLAGKLFKACTDFFDEDREINKGNVAVAVFFSLALLGITVILNEGMEDFSRSLIPYARTGMVELP